MRVLQILHSEERGGIETLSAMIDDGLTSRGYSIDTIYLFPRPGLGAIAKLIDTAKAALRLLRDDHDALIAYQATASVLTGICGRLRGCHCRIVHQTAIPGATAWPVRLADRLAGTLGMYTANIANTAFTRDEFRTYPASYRRSMRLIVHGLAKRPAATRSRAETRARFGWPSDARLILNVGRLTAQKNQRILIDAFAGIEDALLIVAGHGPDQADLLARAEAAGVRDRVHLLGAVNPDDVADLYAACDVFAFPSTWETFGLAAAEAAMAGIPMVVSDLAVLREVLASDASPVTFVAGDDIRGWSTALRSALDAPPSSDVRAEFADEMAARYAVGRMIDSYVDLLTAIAPTDGRF